MKASKWATSIKLTNPASAPCRSRRLSGHGLPTPPVGKIAVAIARRTSRIYTNKIAAGGDGGESSPVPAGGCWPARGIPFLSNLKRA